MTNFTFAERDKRYRKVAASQGNAHARRIVRRLERLREAMAAFLRDHPHDPRRACQCDFCQDNQGKYGPIEVEGGLWMVRHFIAVLEGITFEPDRDALRRPTR